MDSFRIANIFHLSQADADIQKQKARLFMILYQFIQMTWWIDCAFQNLTQVNPAIKKKNQIYAGPDC